MRLPVLQNPNKILRNISKPVEKEEFQSTTFQKLIEDMSETLAGESDGVALAAPQIGVNKRIFVVSGRVFNFKEDGSTDNFKYKDMVFVNPEFVKISKDKKMMHEGCLSVRPYYGDIRRASRATIRAQDENGEWFEMSGSGLLAEIFQHETDHLDGVLFIDNATNVREVDMPEIIKSSKKK